MIVYILYRQLEFEFAIQWQDIAFHITEQEHQSTESGYHRNADILHRSTVVGGGIVNDHRGKQVVGLVGRGHLQIGGTDQR